MTAYTPTDLHDGVRFLGGIAPAADAIGIAPRTLERMVAGQRDIPPGIWRDLCEAIDHRITTMQQWQARHSEGMAA